VPLPPAALPPAATPPALTAVTPDSARSIALRDLDLLSRCSGVGRGSPEAELQRLRTEYLLAVEDPTHLAGAWETHRALVRTPWGRSTSASALLEGYRGALLALEAKHGSWPLGRVRDLQAGLGILDTQVAKTPRETEVRYLRLVSAAYLPSLFRRGAEADEDLRMVLEGLPARTGDLPMRTWVAMADTVEGFLARPPWGGRRATQPSGTSDLLRRLADARALARERQLPLAPGCHALAP
jgi:hypothetical protein